MRQAHWKDLTSIKWVLIGALGALLSSGLSGCSNSSEGDLITDAIPLGECPQSSCAQGVADPAETKLVLQTPISNVIPTGSSFAEVAGDCYASLFPDNRFEVTLNGAAATPYLPAGFVPRCNNGKFYFPLNLQGLAAGNYQLSAQLVVINAQGVPQRPPFKIVQSLIIKTTAD